MITTARIALVVTALSAACAVCLAVEATTQSSAPRSFSGVTGATGGRPSSAPPGATLTNRASGMTNSGLTAAGIRPAGTPAPTPPPAGTALGLTDATKIQSLSTFCLTPTGNILACDAKANCIKVISPADELVATWTLPFAPKSIAMPNADTIFVGGAGILAKLDKAGNVVKQKELDLATLDPTATPTPAPATAKAIQYKPSVASLAASDKDVFAAVMLRTGFAVYRFDYQLEQPTAIITGLRGCCGQMNLQCNGGKLYVPENARFRVAACDRDGKTLSSWGKSVREDKNGFSGCCNPKNMCIGPDGLVYTADSPSGIVKRFTAEGLFVDLVGVAPIGSYCVHAAIYVAPDGRHAYVADVTSNYIRIIGNPAAPNPLPTSAPALTTAPPAGLAR